MSARTPSPSLSPEPLPAELVAAEVRGNALKLPTAYEDAPWGFPVFKLEGNRLFAWMIGEDDGQIEVTIKMTDEERPLALELDWVRPASHLGRYGWVTASVGDRQALEYVLSWVEESWWLRAPKRLRPVAPAQSRPLSECGDGC